MVQIEYNIFTNEYRKEIIQGITSCQYLAATDPGTKNIKEAFCTTFTINQKVQVENYLPFIDIILDDILDPDCNLFHMVAMVLYASSEITEHIDDNLIHTYGDDIIKHPKCTTVYYANVPDSMIGGELISENLTITPVTNSLITIPGNVPHRVTEITQATEPRITLIIEQYKVIKYNLQKYDTSNVTIIEG